MLNVESQLPAFYTERRSHSRVRDAICLSVRRLADVPTAGKQQDNQANFPVFGLNKDKSTITGYSQMQREYPEVAEHIYELEERIEQLSLERGVVRQLPTHKVTLSAVGLTFSHGSLFLPGESVCLTLTLFPSGQRIVVDAKIVSANEPDDESYEDKPTYRAEFESMKDADQEFLESHIEQLHANCSLLDYTL